MSTQTAPANVASGSTRLPYKVADINLAEYGRKELRLAEQASLWNRKPENRHLPAWWETANIWLFTHQRDWTEPQPTR